MIYLSCLVDGPGAHTVPYIDPAFPERPLVLHAARPRHWGTDTPVLFVHHGVGRNGSAYRDYWLRLVDDIGVLAIAIEFSEASFPEYLWYHFGNLRDEGGSPNPRERWTYGIDERLFAALRAQGLTDRQHFGLFGHSAGGQFVHRMLSFGFRDSVAVAVSANAGTYAMPDLATPWPFGLGETGVGTDSLRQLLEFPITVMTGTRDTKTTGRFFPKGPRSMRQGETRHERAHNYVRAGHAAAEALRTRCAWTVINVPDVGHDGEHMSVAAAPIVAATLHAGVPERRSPIAAANSCNSIRSHPWELTPMKRRDVLKSALAGATALAAPRIVQAEGAKTITFTPHADLASLDPVWTTADITRNFSLAVYDTLYGYDADFNVQPQMVEGHVVSNDGAQWDLTLRDGLAFHDGTPVLARDCVTTIQRFARRDPFGGALIARTDEVSAPSDKVIRFRLKRPFALLPNALAQVYCAIMPERLAKTDALQQVSEAMGSGPFRFLASERIPGQRVVFEKNEKYVPRKDGKPSFNAGPKVVYVDRVVWNFIPDPATASAALTQGEIDWWEQPTIDLLPQLKGSKNLVVTVKDRTGEIGCLRFNHLYPPFDNPAIRRVVVAAIDQKEVMEAVAGAEPSLIKTDVGIFVPGTPMASRVGVEVTRGPKNYDKLKQDLIAAGYKGEKVVILAASTIPTIWAEAQVASDTLKKIGMNTDFQSMEWGTVVQRRASKEPIDKGGWNIFYTYLGGFGNITPAPAIPIQSSGTNGSWFGWPTDPKMEALRAAWFDAPDVAAQKKICDEMQAEFWQSPPYAPLGMYDQPTAFHGYLTDIRDGWPQFYGVRKNV